MPGRFSRLGGASDEPGAGEPPAEAAPGDAPTSEHTPPPPAAPEDEPATVVQDAVAAEAASDAAPAAAPEPEAEAGAVAASELVAEPAPQPEPEPEPEPEPGFAERGRLRRRLRQVRQLRELALRDLGGMVFDLHRFERERPDLVTAKLEALAALDTEMRTLETVLRDRREVVVLHEAGLTACAVCGTLLGSDARFCSHCATPVGEPAASAAPAAIPAATAPAAPSPPPTTPPAP